MLSIKCAFCDCRTEHAQPVEMFGRVEPACPGCFVWVPDAVALADRKVDAALWGDNQ
jgi:hypothetical protein